MIELFTLDPGEQTPDEVAARVAGFLGAAKHSLDLALYDVRLSGEAGDVVRGALDAATARGVRVRIIYNADHPGPIPVPPPPETSPDLIETLRAETRAIPGIPDLMHHKYVVRDGNTVWTGSMNWTDDSFSRQENVVAVVRSAEVAAAYTEDFEQLWQTGAVERSGFVEPQTIGLDGTPVRVWFTPGNGEDLSSRIARAIARAKRACESPRRW